MSPILRHLHDIIWSGERRTFMQSLAGRADGFTSFYFL